MRLKLITIAPKYQMNAGYIARVAKNFGIEQLFFVNPRANIRGKKAIMFSKHAFDLLQKAKTYKSFDEATRGCDVIVGSTGIWRKGEKTEEREYTLKAAIRKIKKEYSRNAVVGLLLGRDDTGLSREEVEKCDIIVHIPSNKDYPVLNISHALAIMLYEFKGSEFTGYETLKQEKAMNQELLVLANAFDSMTAGKKIRNRKAVRNIFARMVRKAQLNRSEVHALITALK